MRDRRLQTYLLTMAVVFAVTFAFNVTRGRGSVYAGRELGVEDVSRQLAASSSDFQSEVLGDGTLTELEYRRSAEALVDCVGQEGVTLRSDLSLDPATRRFEIYFVYPPGDHLAIRAFVDYCNELYFDDVMKVWDRLASGD